MSHPLETGPDQSSLEGKLEIAADPTEMLEVREALADAVGVNPEKITPQSRWKEIGLDSLEQIRVVMDMEDRFDLSINDDAFQGAIREAGGDPTVEEILK